MIQPQSALAAQDDANASVGELLRTRALTNSPQWLFGQLVVGVAINAALLVWFPRGWGIATAGMATVLLHTLWSVAVRRTRDVVRDVDSDEVVPDYSARSAWWPVRRIAAIAGSASALVLLWFVCLFMLGRLMS